VKRLGPKTEPCRTLQDDDKMEEEVEPEVTKNDLSYVDLKPGLVLQ